MWRIMRFKYCMPAPILILKKAMRSGVIDNGSVGVHVEQNGSGASGKEAVLMEEGANGKSKVCCDAGQ